MAVLSPREATCSILKPGKNNDKLGSIIQAKKWTGKRIFSVTLDIPSTCPTTCLHETDCYGLRMYLAHRFTTDGLEEQLETELNQLLKRFPQGIVVRLHVLGDFYSEEYVAFWARMLKEHSELCIFGYTSRDWDSIFDLNEKDRCWIRHSSHDSKHLQSVGESYEGKSFICPEQLDKTENCASCGLCWTTTKTVKFLTH